MLLLPEDLLGLLLLHSMPASGELPLGNAAVFQHRAQTGVISQHRVVTQEAEPQIGGTPVQPGHPLQQAVEHRPALQGARNTLLQLPVDVDCGPPASVTSPEELPLATDRDGCSHRALR